MRSLKQCSNRLLKSVKTFALVSALALSGAGAAQAQKQPDSVPGKFEIARSSAATDGKSGAFVEWQTNYEVNTIGYNLYRVAGAKRILVNSNLIPGSIAEIGENRALEAGTTHAFFDRDGTLKSQYIVEALLLNGERATFGVAVVYDRDAAAKAKDLRAAQTAASSTANLDDYQIAAAKSDETIRNADFDKQRWVAAQPGVKISVKNTGLYRVTKQQLVDAGFDATQPTANWQLYTDGVEQSILITGEENGFLGTNGYVEFFGSGVDTVYTDKRVYYLVVGASAGKRMISTEPRAAKPRTFSSSFQTVVQCRTTVAANCNTPNFYAPSIINGEADNWFGSLVFTTSPTNLTLNLPSATSSGGESTIELSLQGYLTSQHAVTVTLNNNVIGTVTGTNFDLMRKTFSVPNSMLRTGSNTVSLQGTGGANDASFVDYVRINYNRQYQASGNALLFKTGLNQAARVNGFTTPNIRVFDVTDTNNVSQFRYTLQQNGLTYSTVILTTRPRTMIAVGSAQFSTPVSITANAPSSIYDSAINQDLLIVTYKDWKSAANALAAQRQNQGLTAQIVDVEDIFDEFSYGLPTPAALKAFFARATPHYVVLFGDSSVDPRNYVSAAFANFVPTAYFDSGYGQIVTDEMLGDTTQPDTDYVAEFPIGRLPARNLDQANTMVNKIIAFENSLATNGDPFARGTLFINDDPIGYDFYASNQAMIAQLPAGTPVQIVQRNGATSATADPVRAEILSKANQGPYIVGYAGHGTQTAWTSGSIFRSPQESNQLAASSNRLSMYIFLTCLNGAFAEYNADSLSEAIVKSPGGGVLVWSSSGQTIADGQDIMGADFYSHLRQAPTGARVGDMMRLSKLETFDSDVRISWILLGDPSMRIK